MDWTLEPVYRDLIDTRSIPDHLTDFALLINKPTRCLVCCAEFVPARSYSQFYPCKSHVLPFSSDQQLYPCCNQKVGHDGCTRCMHTIPWLAPRYCHIALPAEFFAFETEHVPDLTTHSQPDWLLRPVRRLVPLLGLHSNSDSPVDYSLDHIGLSVSVPLAALLEALNISPPAASTARSQAENRVSSTDPFSYLDDSSIAPDVQSKQAFVTMPFYHASYVQPSVGFEPVPDEMILYNMC